MGCDFCFIFLLCFVGFVMEFGSVENLCIVYRSRDFLVVNKYWDVRIDSKIWRETLIF